MFSKRGLIAIAALGVFTVTGCAVSNSVSEEELGLRKTDLYSEEKAVAENTNYVQPAAGESKMHDRAFENAPPMISHNVEGMLPITTNNNSCLGCHDPAVAEAVNAVAVPVSHLASFRPKTKMAGDAIEKDGKAVTNTSDVLTAVHKQNTVSYERYNCSLCHAPQSNNEPLIENEFQSEFRTADGASKSNLLDNLNEGVQ